MFHGLYMFFAFLYISVYDPFNLGLPSLIFAGGEVKEKAKSNSLPLHGRRHLENKSRTGGDLYPQKNELKYLTIVAVMHSQGWDTRGSGQRGLNYPHDCEAYAIKD